MVETKYGKYILREPLHKGTFPILHACGEGNCVGADFPGFPAGITMMCVNEPTTMNPKPHAHNFDQYLCFIGSNPKNFFEFDAEIEITLGEEAEVHKIDTNSILYIPKGLLHCPLVFKKVNKPVILLDIVIAPVYTRSVGDMSTHPSHESHEKYSLDEIIKLRGK